MPIRNMSDAALLDAKKYERFAKSMRILAWHGINVAKHRDYWHSVALTHGPRAMHLCCYVLKHRTYNQQFQRIKYTLRQDLQQNRDRTSLARRDLTNATQGAAITREYEKVLFLIQNPRKQ